MINKRQMKLNLTNIFKILSGFFIIVFILWNRVFRTRIPRDIPLELTSETFIILIFVCFILIYIIITKLLKNKKTSLITLYYYSFLQSVEYFIFFSNKSISDGVIALQYKVIFFLEKKNYNNNHIYVICNIFPRLIVTLTFFFELFILGKIRFFYLLLPLLIIPLSLTYAEYCLKDLYNKQCTKLNNILTIIDLNSNDHPINLCDYIELLVLNRLQVHSIKFNYLTTISKQHIKNHLISNNSTKIFNYTKALNYYLPMVDTLLIHYTIYYKYIQVKSKYKLLDILIYLISWFYILVISFHTLDPLALVKLLSWLPPSSSNPFI